MPFCDFFPTMFLEIAVYYRRLIVDQEMGCQNGLGLQIAFELMR